MKQSNRQSGSIVAIIAMMFLYAMISFVTNLAAPIGVIWKNQPELMGSNTLGMMGNMMNFLAYVFMGIPAGKMLIKIGYKKTALAAIAVGFIGVLVQYLSGFPTGLTGFWVYLLGAFISGFSVCMLNTVVNPMLNTLGGGGNKGNQLIQFGGSLNSLAATICPVLVGYLIGEVTSETAISDANPALFIAMGVFALAFVIILFSKIPEPELEAAKSSRQPQESTMESVSKALSHKNLVFGVIAIFLYVGIEVGIPNIANLYMTSPEVGISAGVAGTVVGMYWLLMLCGRLLGGVIGGKVSSKVMMTVVSTVAIVFILIGMFLPETFVKFPAISSDLSFSMVDIPLGVVFFVLCGLCTSVMWGAIFNLAVEGLGKYTSIASGLFMVMVCGGGVLPVIQGAIADKAGFIDSYWVLVIALAYLLVFAVSLSKPSVKSEK